MSRISIDLMPEEHQKLKAMAALTGKSIKDYVIERTLGAEGDPHEAAALKELETLLDERIRGAEQGAINGLAVGAIFKVASHAAKRR
jgi:hypothetical protein